MIITTRSGHVMTESELNKMATIHHEPWRFSSFLPVPNPQVTVTLGQKNKLLLPTTLIAAPHGFDFYLTPQGLALRFIGTGLGNGDSASFEFDAGFASEAVGGSGAELTYQMVTRPYTEVDFQNAVLIPGIFLPRNADNAKIGAVPMVAPNILAINDGDLIEFNVNTDSTTSFILNAFTFSIRELNIV